ncbi:MAG: outer membrane beta-barrel protein [Panacagrimonas sp.]
MRTAGLFVVLGIFCGSAWAQMPRNRVDVYYAFTDFEIDEIDLDMDGDTVGVRVRGGDQLGFLTFELQGGDLDTRINSVKFRNSVQNYRGGVGLRALRSRNADLWGRLEYTRLDTDLNAGGFNFIDDREEGYGVHLGAQLGGAEFNVVAEAGYLAYTNLAGGEYSVCLNWQPRGIGLFVESRYTDLEFDDFDADQEILDLRVGVRFQF